jgi:hypothetical protein
LYRYDLVLFAHKTLRKAAESSASACAESKLKAGLCTFTYRSKAPGFFNP